MLRYSHRRRSIDLELVLIEFREDRDAQELREAADALMATQVLAIFVVRSICLRRSAHSRRHKTRTSVQRVLSRASDLVITKPLSRDSHLNPRACESTGLR